MGRPPVPIVHRYQPTGLTPCGLELDAVAYNEGQRHDEGVTCRRCLAAGERALSHGRPHPRRAQQQLFEEE